MSIFSHDIYENVRTRTIVRYRGAILLLPPETDGGIWGTGVWGLPGGGLEPHESLADCARREVFEETGITVRVGAIALLQEWVVPRYSPAPEGSEGFGYGLEVFHYAYPLEPVPPPRPEHAGEPTPRWVSLTDVPALPIWPKELKALCRQLHEGGMPPGCPSFTGRFGESPWTQPEYDSFPHPAVRPNQ